jgi:hypothetical protein
MLAGRKVHQSPIAESREDTASEKALRWSQNLRRLEEGLHLLLAAVRS